MNRTVAFLGTVSLGLLLGAPAARAAGFGINEHSARVMGMGGAFTGVADSPGALFFNPAGLAQLHGLSLELGVTLVTPGSSWTGTSPGGTEVEVAARRGLFPLPNLHAAYRIHDRVAVGFGVYLPYGLTQEWDNTVTVDGKEVAWWGRDIVRKISLTTVYFNPAVAVKLHRRILVGLGFSVVKGAVTLERAVTFSSDLDDDIDFELSGDDVAFGATAGVLIKVLPDLLNLGVAFRSGVNFNFEGSAAFTKDGSGANVPLALRSILRDGPATADLNLPHVISFGIAAFPLAALTVGVNLDVVTWSSYDKLEIKFPDNSDLDSAERKDWNNALAFRIGAEYKVLGDNLPVRAGFIFDQSPVPDDTLGPELPDGNRYEFTVGVGYTLWGFSLDLAYQYLFTDKVKASETSPLPGTYQADAHLAGLSLGYTLDI